MLNICHAVWLNVLCFHPCDTRQKLTVSNCTQQNNHQTHRKLHCVIYSSNADTKMHSLQVFIYHFAPLFQGYFEFSFCLLFHLTTLFLTEETFWSDMNTWTWQIDLWIDIMVKCTKSKFQSFKVSNFKLL